MEFLMSFGLLFVIVFSLLVLLLPILALISLLKNDFKGDDKIIWIVVILFLPMLGSILYFLFGRNKKLS